LNISNVEILAVLDTLLTISTLCAPKRITPDPNPDEALLFECAALKL